MGARPSFLFRTIDVFDPRKTWLRAALPLPLFWLAWVANWASWGLLLASVGWFWFLSRADARRQTCVLLRFEEVSLKDLHIDDHSAKASLWVASGDVSRLDSSLRRHKPRPIEPGLRSVPVVFAETGGRTVWVESGQVLDLEPDELRGALSVVLSGENLRCELMVAAKPGNKPRPRGVLLESSNGVLQSWDSANLSARPTWL